MMVELLYWTTFYVPGTLQWSNPETWFEPLGLHLMPLVFLTVEWLLNNRLFNMPRSYLYFLYIALAYSPLAYFGKDFMGYFPYNGVSFDNFYTIEWIALSLSLQAIFYWSTGILTNLIKGSWSTPNPLIDN